MSSQQQEQAIAEHRSILSQASTPEPVTTPAPTPVVEGQVHVQTGDIRNRPTYESADITFEKGQGYEVSLLPDQKFTSVESLTKGLEEKFGGTLSTERFESDGVSLPDFIITPKKAQSPSLLEEITGPSTAIGKVVGTDIEAGLTAFYTAEATAGFEAGRLAAGKGEANPASTESFGISDKAAISDIADSATFLTPLLGPASHVLANPQEPLAEKALDVTFAALPLVPVGEISEGAADILASTAGRIGVGAGLSAGYTASTGNLNPEALAESAAIGAATGYAAPYAFKGLGDLGHTILYSDTEMVSGGFAGSMQDIELTEQRGAILNEAGEIQGREGQIGEGGRPFASPREIGNEAVSPAELATNVGETGLKVTGLEESSIERSLINQDVESLNENLLVKNAADYLAGRSALDVAATETGETATISTLRGPFQSLKDAFDFTGIRSATDQVALGSVFGEPETTLSGMAEKDFEAETGQSEGGSSSRNSGPAGLGGAGLRTQIADEDLEPQYQVYRYPGEELSLDADLALAYAPLVSVGERISSDLAFDTSPVAALGTIAPPTFEPPAPRSVSTPSDYTSDVSVPPLYFPSSIPVTVTPVTSVTTPPPITTPLTTPIVTSVPGQTPKLSTDLIPLQTPELSNISPLEAPTERPGLGFGFITNPSTKKDEDALGSLFGRRHVKHTVGYDVLGVGDVIRVPGGKRRRSKSR